MLAHLVGEVAEHRVAAVVAVGVVDLLEAVDVTDEKRHRLPGQVRLLLELVEPAP